MGKNIVICCDGTGNQFGEHNTNVIKTYAALDLGDSDRQIALYDPGVGTGNPRGASSKFRRTGAKLSGLALGTGLFQNVADAYRFLMTHFQPDDRVFVFGFSRGAYTARALAGMLYMVGLLQAGNESHISYALDLYRSRVPKDKAKRDKHFETADAFKSTFSRPCPIHFLGLWDTVKTVGLWDALKLFTRLGTALPWTYQTRGVEFGRHAIALDERRSRFRTNLWAEEIGNSNLQQVWFPGVHSDIGGGYADSGLSDIALKWILTGAHHKGLILRGNSLPPLSPQPNLMPHESLTLPWRVMGWKQRDVRGPGNWNQAESRFEHSPPRVHFSAMGHQRYEKRLPSSTLIVKKDDWDAYPHPL